MELADPRRCNSLLRFTHSVGPESEGSLKAILAEGGELIRCFTITTRPLPILASLLSGALLTRSKFPRHITSPSRSATLPAPSPEEIPSASLGTLFCRFRIQTTDKRRQKLFFGITIAKSVFPSDDMNGMEIDGGGQEGFDVVCLKKEADPLEMKRVWRKIVERMPKGVIVAT